MDVVTVIVPPTLKATAAGERVGTTRHFASAGATLPSQSSHR
jgi:hypothetical protein